MDILNNTNKNDKKYTTMTKTLTKMELLLLQDSSITVKHGKGV